jgi:hypothetical protein
LAPAQVSEHFELLVHESEHELSQETSHVAPSVQDALPDLPSEIEHVAPVHETLPLSPAVSVHDVPAAHWALHEAVHVPAQLPVVHWIEQWPPDGSQLV